MGYNVSTLDQAQIIHLKNKVIDLMLENIDMMSSGAIFQQILNIPYQMDLTGNPQGVIKFLTALRPFEEWTGEVNKQTLESKGLQIIPKHFSKSITVTKHDLKMGIIDSFYMAAREMGDLAVRKEFESICKFFEDASSINGYDGAVFFGNGHSNGQDNDLSSSGHTLAIPTVEKAEKEILTAISTMQGFKNEQGSPSYYGGYSGQALLLLAPNTLYPTLKKLEILDYIAPNVNNGLKGLVKVIQTPILSNGTATSRSCYLLDNSMTIKPAIKVIGYPLESEMYEDKNSQSLVFTANMSYEMGPGDWKAAVKQTFTN